MDVLSAFGTLTAEESVALKSILKVRSVKAGATVFVRGTQGESCFVLVAGEVQICTQLPDGSDVCMAHLEPGSLFGQLALIEPGPRAATCRAGGDGAKLLELMRADFDAAFAARSSFAYTVLDQVVVDLAARLRDTTQRLVAARRSGKRDQALRAATTLHGMRSD